jgi:hypothetical protein
MTLLPSRDTPTVSFVADNVDQAWNELGPYLLHDAVGYAQWNRDNQVSAGITNVDSVDALRAEARTHRIFTVDEAIEFTRGGGILTLSPLCGGIPPEIA